MLVNDIGDAFVKARNSMQCQIILKVNEYLHSSKEIVEDKKENGPNDMLSQERDMKVNDGGIRC